MTKDRVIFIDANCTNVNNSNPVLLLCGKSDDNNSLMDSSCQCPTADQLLLSATKIRSAIKNQLMCTNYNKKNVDVAARLLIPRDSDETLNSWNSLLIVCRFYSHNNLLDLVDQLITINSTDVMATTADGFNALMVLSRYSNNEKIVQVAKLLIAKGIGVNHVTSSGFNALMILSWFSQSDRIIEIAQLLIDQGSDIHRQDNDGKNSVTYVIMSLFRKLQNGPNGATSSNERHQYQPTNSDGINALMYLVSSEQRHNCRISKTSCSKWNRCESEE